MRHRSLAAWWQEYESQVIPRAADDIQRQEMRNAFYAGAGAVMQVNFEIGEPSVSEEEGLRMLDRLRDELLGFVREKAAEAEVMKNRRKRR